MKISLYFIAFCILLGMPVNAQFKFDAQKVSSIRWTPTPASINELKDFKIDLNGQWSFTTTPETDFWKKNKIEGWKSIEVPGEWVMQGFDVEKGKAAGYQRTFQIPTAWNGYRIKLKCEAVYSNCEVWVNGKNAGSHLGGLTPFELDVTDHIQHGENRIALAVKSESLADTLSGASQYAVHPMGGITRPIYLIALPEVNVASFHVTTQFDKDYIDAVLNAEIKIANECKINQNIV